MFNTIERAISSMQLLSPHLQSSMREALQSGDYTTGYEVCYIDASRGYSSDQDAIRQHTEAIMEQTMVTLGHQD